MDDICMLYTLRVFQTSDFSGEEAVGGLCDIDIDIEKN